MNQTLTLTEARNRAMDEILAEWFNSAEESQLDVNEWALLQRLVTDRIVATKAERATAFRNPQPIQ